MNKETKLYITNYGDTITKRINDYINEPTLMDVENVVYELTDELMEKNYQLAPRLFIKFMNEVNEQEAAFYFYEKYLNTL